MQMQLLLLWLLLISSCATADDAFSAVGHKTVSVRQFVDEPASFDKSTITVRGYLGLLPPHAAVFEDERQRPDALVYIDDRSLEGKSTHTEGYFEAFYLQELGCAQKYVEVTGIVAPLPVGVYGIAEIKSIRTFSDAEFSNSEGICYSAR